MGVRADSATPRRRKVEPPDPLTRAIQAVVRRQRIAFLAHPNQWDTERWDTELAEAMETPAFDVAYDAARRVAEHAPLGVLHGYIRGMIRRQAAYWNEETRQRAVAAAAAEKAASVDDVFNDAGGARAGQLAQDVTTRVAGFATVDTAKRVGKAMKTWVTGSNPRPSHAAMNGQTVPVDQPFPNGMMWPAGKNCNCSVTISGEADQLVEPLRADDFDIPAESMSRTRAVSNAEYQDLARKGMALLDGWRAARSRPAALVNAASWRRVTDDAWDAVQAEWGGATIDAHTGLAVRQGAKKYAITIKEFGQDTVSIPIGASRAEFEAALAEARRRFGDPKTGQLWMQKAHLGVFRDEGAGRIDIDPVLVVDDLDQVERIGAYSRSRGGAYSFADGNGYWPPHVT